MNYNKKESLKKRIDGTWEEIKALRAEILALYDQGEPFTSEKYQVLSKRLDERGKCLEELDRQYEDLILEEM